MKTLVLALVLFPAQAWAGTLCPKKLEERTSPCTASPEEQAEITGYIAAGLAAHEKFETALADEARLREEVMILKDQWETEAGKKAVAAWEEAEKTRQLYENRMRSNLKLATDKTSAYYGISAQQKKIANGPMNGEAAKWDPEFFFVPKDKDGRYKKLYFEMERSDGVKHYSSTGGANPDNANAMTDADGKSIMFISAFEDAKSNPGRLAWALQHEAVHVGHLTSDGWASSEAEEARTLKADADMADSFELSQDFRDALENKRAEYAAKISLAKAHPNEIKYSLHSPFPGPRTEEGYKREFGIAQADLDKIKQARAALHVQVEKSRQELADKERQAQYEEEKRRELAKKQAFRTEMDAEAASCGYRIHYAADNKTMLGFGDRSTSFILGRKQVYFDFGDLKVVFLMTRTCLEIESNANQPPHAACNGAAQLMHERVGRGDFVPKLAYLTATMGWTYSDRSECIRDLLANADKITDAKSFDKVAASYQKRLSKRLAQEAKRDRKREDRERKEDRGGGTPPPDGNDYFWDPSCECWVRRY